jgi:hypothetical protein
MMLDGVNKDIAFPYVPIRRECHRHGGGNESALMIESARVAAGKTYEAMTSEERSTIIKCLFKIRGEAGFSKISSMKDTTANLAALGDVGALLRADVVSDIEPTAEVETPRAVLGDLPADKQAELEKTQLEILALFDKCRLLVHCHDAAPADAPSAPPNASSVLADAPSVLADAPLAPADAPSREI